MALRMTKQQLLTTTLEKETARIPIWLVDDNRLYSTIVSSVLNESSQVECTRTFLRCEAAIEALREGGDPPKVILLDIEMPGMGGLAAIKPFKAISPSTRVIMITVYNEEEYVRTAMKCGASGYLLKQSSASEFIRAIQNAVQGGMPVDPFVVPNMMKALRSKTFDNVSSAQYGLTDREKEFLRYLAKGIDDQEISMKMFVSYNTVLYHTKRIYAKLGVHSRRELMVKSLREGLI
jgi:DNA-binding NarL/FixJ family response regulator